MTKIRSNEAFINALTTRFNNGENKIHAFDHEHRDGVVTISAEHGDMINEWPVGDYYDAAIYDPQEKHHVGGINRTLNDWCTKHGWTLEWKNPGEIGAYREF